MVKFFIGILYFFSECNFHFFLYWSSSDTLLSSDWILGPAHSYAVCTYETRYWAQPFSMQFEHMRQLAPTITPQDLAFRLLGRKGRFWFSHLICLMIGFYGVKSQHHVFVFLWLIPDSSVPKACLHLILATPLSPTFNGWMKIQRRLSFLGIWAGEFPLPISAPL